MCIREVISVVLWLVALTEADLSDTNPETGTCICLDANVVNVRDRGCGNVIGTANIGDCWTYNGNKVTCELSGTKYVYFDLAYNNASGWLAGDYLVTSTSSSCQVVQAPDPEQRALFIATVSNIDWPTSGYDSTADQRNQMLDYLDRIANMNMNTVVFQVRPAADAFYDSSIEPWSKYLTGTQGVAPEPYYDPLAFTISEAHARGIEVHAWLNPYRANLVRTTDDLAPNHACLDPVLSQYCYPYDEYMWLDPGAPEVVDRLVSVIQDIINRYDVDGIHFDDYFYPYPDGTVFPDDVTYAMYGGGMARDDWRRDNVNRMVERVYNVIRNASSTVKFSISPFGIYRPGHPDGMQPPITGMDPYTELFADAKLWLQNGWLDFLAPQLYWSIDGTGQSYPVLLDYWLQWNTQARYVYAANAVYKIADSNDWDIAEIGDQVSLSRDPVRRSSGSLGNIMFSGKYFRDNTDGIYDYFINTVYPTPASVPPTDWLPGACKPKVPSARALGSLIMWQPPVDDVTNTWAVYRKLADKWIMLKRLPRSTTIFRVRYPGIYSVIAASRCNQLSDSALVSVIADDGKA